MVWVLVVLTVYLAYSRVLTVATNVDKSQSQSRCPSRYDACNALGNTSWTFWCFISSVCGIDMPRSSVNTCFCSMRSASRVNCRQRSFKEDFEANMVKRVASKLSSLYSAIPGKMKSGLLVRSVVAPWLKRKSLALKTAERWCSSEYPMRELRLCNTLLESLINPSTSALPSSTKPSSSRLARNKCSWRRNSFSSWSSYAMQIWLQFKLKTRSLFNQRTQRENFRFSISRIGQCHPSFQNLSHPS